MFAYIVRRLGVLVVILFGSSFTLYNLAAMSGDPLQDLRASGDPTAAQQIVTLTQQLNLDVPPPLRYFMWLRGVLGSLIGQGDFGMTRDGQLVTTALATAIPITIRLVLLSTIISIIFGVAIGIITALRQYSRFDYAMTFISFLLYSLPIFWVAVLLKQFLAIEFNDFLMEPSVGPTAIAAFSITSGIVWAALISGSRRRVWAVFGLAAAGTAAFLVLLNVLDWFATPRLGIIGVTALGVGSAYAMVQLSTGLANKAALRASLGVAGFGAVAYFPAQLLFGWENQWLALAVLLVAVLAVTVALALALAKVDRGPVLRTGILTALGVYSWLVFDRLLRTWQPYMETDAVNYRPVPTTGQVNPLLEPGDFWLTTLDVVMHLLLPTIALALIHFAMYVRYARGTLLDVMNQDYIRTARAKGLPERTVIMRHAFRNTMIPLTTVMVVDFAGVIGGAIITERVFGWVGMGTLFNQAVTTLDLNLLMGVFLVTGTLAVLANLVADLLYSALDPRIRVGAN